MTYRTPLGDRIVRGAEAEFFREALYWTVHDVRLINGDDNQFTIRPFDRLTYGQQLTGVLTVARALLDENVPPPPLTASIEACTAQILEKISEEVVLEIDLVGEVEPELKSVRLAIRAAILEKGDIEAPVVDCTDRREWLLCIKTLSQGFLLDGNYEEADDCTDAPKEATEEYRRANTTPDYFFHVLDDPPESQWQAIERELCDLAKRRGVSRKNYRY